MKRGIALVVASIIIFAAPQTRSQGPQPGNEKSPPIQEKVAAPPTKEELEKKFQETLSGATLVGQYTTGGQEKKEQSPAGEKYTIESVSKIAGDYWLFTARIQYGGRDYTLPLPLRVLWAGTTPVITLDKVPVGRGTYSARVMIHDGKYAGMWDAGDHGGLLSGKIVKEPAKDNKSGNDPMGKAPSQ